MVQSNLHQSYGLLYFDAKLKQMSTQAKILSKKDTQTSYAFCKNFYSKVQDLSLFM